MQGCNGPLTSTLAPSAVTTVATVHGRVTDRSSGSSLPNATIAVAGGPTAGLSVRTDMSGEYTLTLVNGTFTVNVIIAGYVPNTLFINLTGDMRADFQVTRTLLPIVP